jgi:hypothetical protein
MVFLPHRKDTYGPPRPLTGVSFIILYVYDVRTSQATRPVTEDSFTFLYVDGVRTSQETHVLASPFCSLDLICLELRWIAERCVGTLQSCSELLSAADFRPFQFSSPFSATKPSGRKRRDAIRGTRLTAG